MGLTGIVGGVRAPIILAQRSAFLNSHLLRDMVVIRTTTLALTFPTLSSGFLRAFLCGLFIGLGIYYLKNNQELPNTLT